MPIKSDKAIAVGMAGLLLLFIAIYLSMYIAGVNMDTSSGGSLDDLSSMMRVLIYVIVALIIFIIIGFTSALVASNDISSYRDAIKVSSISGLVPASIVIVGIIYLILYLGISAALLFSVIGLVFFIICMFFSAIGGMIGYYVARTYFKQNLPL
jgi:hypothetical protein